MTQELAEKLLLENLKEGEKVLLFGPGKFNRGLSRGQFYGAFALIVVDLLLLAFFFDYWPYILGVGAFAIWRKTSRPAPASNAEYYAVTNNRLVSIDASCVSMLAMRSELARIAAREDKVNVIWKDQILVINPIRKRLGE